MVNNNVAKRAPVHGTIIHALERNARLCAEKPALVLSDKKVITWLDLWEASKAQASRLTAEHVRHGDIVFVAGMPSLELYTLLWACARIGAIFAPLNLQFTASEYQQYISRLLPLRSAIFVADKLFQNKFSGISENIPKFALSDRDANDTWRIMAESSTDFDAPFPQPEDGLFLISTSGSTGFPKPALLPHRAASAQAENLVSGGAWNKSDRLLAMSPMFHMGGLSPVGASAVSGGAIHVMAGFDPAVALRRIEEEEITLLSAFDVMLDRLMSLPDFDVAKMKSIRRVSFAGSPKYYKAIQSWGVTDIATGYAMSEAWGIAQTPTECTNAHLRQWSVGTVTPDVQIKIIDPISGLPQGAGESGEICVRGSTLFLGYLGQDAETQKSFDSEGFFHTGDRGRLTDGYLFFEGRYKSVIKTGGENVSELEIENFLGAEFPEIRQVAVVGAPDDTWGEIVCAFIEFEIGKELTLDVIRTNSREKLAGFKLPRRLILMQANEWPQLATGKLNKAALRQRAAVLTSP